MNKFLSRIFLFLTTLVIVNYIVYYEYSQPYFHSIKKNKHIKSIKWKSVKEQKYDIIILGSSRGFCAYNPNLIDSITNYTSYNMCTGGQNIIESYYILKEILNYQKPKIIVYEVFLPSLKSIPDFHTVFENSDFMSNKNKVAMTISYGARGIFNYIFPIYRDREYIKKGHIKISNSLLIKETDIKTTNETDIKTTNETDIKTTNETDIKTTNEDTLKKATWNKGFLYDLKKTNSSILKNKLPLYNFSNTEVNDKFIKEELNKLNKLCIENNIKLICVRAPYSPTRVSISSNDTIHFYLSNFFDKSDIIFKDFGYTNVEYFDEDFSDYHHMNIFGATKVSSELSYFIKEIAKKE